MTDINCNDSSSHSHSQFTAPTNNIMPTIDAPQIDGQSTSHNTSTTTNSVNCNNNNGFNMDFQSSFNGSFDTEI